ncbi:MAG: site-specific DNA-methyltransferase [Lactococcus lactis]|nr:site-specific DNA-methyltransferase [Lactococcus lactis]MDN6749527.1 site-specific DNA-methyltransferase [Staphylococcus equorum]
MAENKIETELLSQIKEVLLTFSKYWEEDVLLRNKVAEDLRSYNPELIEALLSNELVKDTYSIALGSTNIFKIEEFISMLRYKNYWENSYTKYTNEIGLTSEGKYLNYNTDVVLDFPHKDSILEGGMTKEEQGKKEIYYHNVLAKEEIDTLLSPKVFTNMKKYNKDEVHEITQFTDKDNLIIKGNNLIALHSLKERYANKIKLIYIDPPYNTGNDGFKYNDKFNRSTWLTFMKNRLELAKKLLTDDGAIYVQLDYHQAHYGKVLMDEIFGEENFEREIIWRIGWISGYKSADNNWIRNHDTILFYSKDSKRLDFIKNYIPKEEFKSIAVSKAERYPIEDVWNGNEYDDLNSIAIVSFSGETVSKMLNKGDEVKGQKSEKLIERIFKAHTRPGDIVMDFFGGSGTSAAVAHKMGLQYIICEQLDKHIDISLRRMCKVISGEQRGISKKNNWQGGGSFVYAELSSLNDKYIKDIQDSSNEAELEKVLATMKESAYLNFKVDLEKVSSTNEGYNNLSLEEKKKVLIQVLDMNQLYLSYSEMEDEQYNIPEDVKAFNHSFYQKEGVKDE